MNDEDHNLLIRIDERTSRMEIWMTNHDAHHFKYSLMAWGVALTAIVAVIAAIYVK
jgi:hypothetical protein